MASSSQNYNNTQNSTSTNHGSEKDDVNVTVLVSIVLMVLVIVGNLLVILAYKKNQRLRTGTYTFLVSLAISDFLVGSVSIPLWIYVTVRGKAALHSALYTFYICFDIFSALASTFHLTAVTAERFIAISRPFYYKTITLRSYFVWIGLAWGLAFIFATLHEKVALALVDNPSIDLIFTYRKVHSVIMFTFGYLAPMILITSMNIGIFKIARRLIRTSTRPSQASIDANMATFTQRTLSKERKTAITLVMITGLFFVAWMPFFVINMLSLFCLRPCLLSYMQRKDLFFLAEVSKWFHYSNSAINVVVYTFRDVEMRRTFISLILPFCETAQRIGPGSLDATTAPAVVRTRNHSNSSAYYAEYMKTAERVELEVPHYA